MMVPSGCQPAEHRRPDLLQPSTAKSASTEDLYLGTHHHAATAYLLMKGSPKLNGAGKVSHVGTYCRVQVLYQLLLYLIGE